MANQRYDFKRLKGYITLATIYLLLLPAIILVAIKTETVKFNWAAGMSFYIATLMVFALYSIPVFLKLINERNIKVVFYVFNLPLWAAHTAYMTYLMPLDLAFMIFAIVSITAYTALSSGFVGTLIFGMGLLSAQMITLETIDNPALTSQQKQGTFYFGSSMVIVLSVLASFIRSTKRDLKKQKKELEQKQEIMNDELSLARIIQLGLLPQNVPEYAGLRIAPIYLPVDAVGGDFYDFIQFRDDAIGIFIADVSGHGVPAAMIASMVKSCISAQRDYQMSTDTFLKKVNDNLFPLVGNNFVTCFYAIFDLNKRELSFSNAGHPAPFLMKQRGEVAILKSPGPALGFYKNIKIEEKTISLDQGDKLFIFTDGLFEVNNQQREQLGEEGLAEILTRAAHLGDIKHCVQRIIEEIKSYQQSHLFEDDITLLGIDVK